MNPKEFISALRRTFFPKSPDFSRLYDTDAIERRVVARFSRSNIRLQQGKYLTREQLDKRIERFLERTEKHDG
ncbi:MAG: hypothetical protein ACNYPH_06600 [Gammaproteobacteria bacterium WSBS_2016_MAG_OTU1]